MGGRQFEMTSEAEHGGSGHWRIKGWVKVVCIAVKGVK